MFTRLVASRPTPGEFEERRGFLLSGLLHGSIIAASVLATSQVTPLLPLRAERVVPVHSPPAPERRPVESTRAPSRAPARFALEARIDAPDLVLPDLPNIPAGIPDPSEIATVFGRGDRRGPFTGVDGRESPATGPGGAFSGVQVDVPAVLSPASPRPRYPEALNRLRVEGVVRMLFIVDTLGRVEAGTARVVESGHPAFEAAVRATLPRLRFEPARLAGQPVRQLVEFPIVFTIEP